MCKRDILIVGATPKTAGIGGVSIHVERLVLWLKHEACDFLLCDYKSESLFRQINKIVKYRLIHIHASRPMLRVLYVILSKLLFKKSVLTIHGNLGRFSKVENHIDSLAIKWCDVPILINQESYDKAIRWNKNSKFLSAFIPPIENGYIPDFIINKINIERTKGQIIYATNASACTYTIDDLEIYGIEFLVNYFNRESNRFLIISDPSGQYGEKYSASQFENIIFVSENHSFYEVLKYSDVMIRATATDGDSLSIKEALSLGKQVLATDCVDRPQGVILFKYNDILSFEMAVNTAQQLLTHKTVLIEGNVVISIMDIYTKLLK